VETDAVGAQGFETVAEEQRRERDEAEQVAEEGDLERRQFLAHMLRHALHDDEAERGHRHQHHPLGRSGTSSNAAR